MKIIFFCLSILLLSFGLFAQVQVWRYADSTMGIYSAQNMNIDAKANIYASGPAIFHNSNAGVPNASIVLKLDSSGVYHWSQGFVNGNYNNIYFGMAGDTLGNTYICGEFNDSNTFVFDAYLTHIDSSGNLVWNDEYDKAGYYDANNNVEVDKTGNVYVAGTGNDVNYNQGMIGSKFTAADSTPVWREYYFDISTGTFYNSYFPVGDNAGGMYNIGQAAFGEQYGNSIVLVKYSSTGTFLWYRVYNSNPYSDEEPASGNADALGNLYLADNSAPQLVNYNYVPYLKKVNTGGVAIWQTLFTDTINSYYLSSSALDASYFYIAGSRNDSIYVGKISASNGNRIWDFVYPGDTSYADKITLKNGAIYVAGVVNNDSSSTSFITLKLDSNGHMIWNVTYDDSLNGSDRANDIVADNSGNVYVAGPSIQAVGSRGSATVIKYYDAQVTCTLSIDSMVTTNATSNLTGDGSAFVVASGGAPPYNYTWSTGEATDTITGLEPNTYCVTVTDSAGCIAITCDSVRPTNLVCNIAIDSVHVTQVTPCYAGSNGTIFVYVSGNIGATSYSIDGGAHYQSDYRFFNVNVGVYNVEIKDAHNCTTGYVNNPITITQPFADTPTITVRGDTFITGLYARYEWVVNGYGVDSDQTFINTQEGDTVNVYVEDTFGCIYSSDTIISTCNLAIESVSVTQVAPCYGGANGAITVHSIGGTGQVSYSIDNGIDYQTDSIFGKLPPGTHVIVAKDSNGCSAIYSGNPVTITQPAADTPILVSSNDTFSAGQYSKYSWYYADSVVDTNQFLVVSTTTYCGYISVQVVDVNGCAYYSDSVFNVCSGINSPGGTNIGVTIYPNPFSETLNISLDGPYNGGAEVQLLDMLGQKLYDDRPAGSTFSISTTGLAQGAYLLRIRAGDQFMYRQVIKD